MADEEIRIGVKVDESGIDKGLTSIKNKLNKSTTDLNKGSKATNALKTAFNETGGAASSFANKMSGIASSGGLAAAGISAAVLASKKFIDALNQANEAYEVQERAEKALQQAADNNPYLNGESVKRLKDYASQLQSVSNYGDEGTIDIMAQLAGTGRSEAEIIKIMGAAADYAAATHTDLASAATALNATYSGMSGTLGRQVGVIKDLTAEQLKNGEAIDLIAQKYKGFAEEAVDDSTQAQNAFGDFMESVGAIANPVFEALNRRAKSFWEEMTNQMNRFSDALETASRKWGIGGIKRAVDEGVNTINTISTNRTTGEEKRGAGFQTKEYLEWLKQELELRGELNAEEQAALFAVEQELKYRERLAKSEQEQAEAEAKKNTAATAALQQEMETRDKLRAVYDDTVAAKKKEITLRRDAGEEITAEAEAQEMYNTAFAAYIKMMSDPAFNGNSGNYEHEVKARSDIADWGKIAAGADLETQIKEFEAQLQQAADEADGIVKNQYDTLLAMLDAEYSAVISNKYIEEEEKLRIEQEYAKKRKGIADAKDREEKGSLWSRIDALTAGNETYWDRYAAKQQEIAAAQEELDRYTAERSEAIKNDASLSEEERSAALIALAEETAAAQLKIDEANAQARKELAVGITTEIKNHTDQAVSLMQEASNIMLETVENQTTAELAELETKYRKGEMGEEEYNEKVAEVKKDAAKEQYKIQMWQWGASILQATANIAQGVSVAIAQGGIAGIITGALVGAAGAVQIASIIASKPSPPNFSTGGIVGGSSYNGDNIAANLNSREMVMNMGQQKSLWDFINGGARGMGGGANIVINNSAANIATAQPQITRDKIEIMIDARVNDSLNRGRYSRSLNAAQQGMSGEYYGI